MIFSSSTETLLFLLAGLFLLLGLEYYLLVFAGSLPLPEFHPMVVKAASGFLQFGGLLRICFLLVYTGFSVSLVRAKQYPQATNPSSGRTKFLLLSLITVVAVYQLYKIDSYVPTIITWLYPTVVVSVLFTLPMFIGQFRSIGNTNEQSERRKIDSEHSIVVKTKRGYLNVVNPYRGTLVMGSSGSGKSESIGNTFLHQFVQKGFCGIVYDFKFPTLAGVVNTALHQYGSKSNLRYYIVNFQDLSRTHRCNPLAPDNIPTLAHAEEYAKAIVNNLDTNTIRHREFFANSAIAWLAALIWFYRAEHPQHCTLPHVINTALYHDYTHVISMLEANPQSADLIRSIATAIRNKAEKQLAGVIASLQIMVTKINSPEIVWVLSGDDFDMDINNSEYPKLLCLGSDPGLVDTYSPVISLIITVALKQMNQQRKQKSFVLLDEAPTLYIPKFEVIPATARSNKVASVYMAQDMAQMVNMYGKEKAEVIIANLSNQFYGKASSVDTARRVSEMIGKEEKLMTNFSTGRSRGSKGGRNLSYNTSTSSQERSLIKPQEVMQLSPGAFVGQTVESTIPYFRAQTQLSNVNSSYRIDAFTQSSNAMDLQHAAKSNFQKIRKEVGAIVHRYPNIYR